MKTLFNLLVIFGFLFIAGCQSDATSTESTTTPISPSLPSEYNESVDMSNPTLNPDSKAPKMIRLAKESLARKFKISEDQINLFSVEAMVWPDASLGCTQSGIIYAQVATPGFQILLEAMGQSFSYHTDDTERVILCDIRPPDNIFLPP